ncbi:hypothetical protein ACQPXH_25100 [Nocardia sp. CA-135953]|uniref:hypothetical protein n=1 Tax=Nocardia sp. CA-135953 TaxID=3239978 RepID=UPI003D970F12
MDSSTGHGYSAFSTFLSEIFRQRAERECDPRDVTDQDCTTHGWSIITSAATHSQLAGVLAGFLFTGIVFLFTRSGRDHTQTIALFTATFFVLAIDSYEYSVIAGNKPAEGRFEEQCPFIWSQMMPAAGSLGVGGVALTCGVTWLLADHASTSPHVPFSPHRWRFWRTPPPPSSPLPTRPDHTLSKLGGLVVAAMVAGTILLLIATTLDYFESVYGHRSGILFALTLVVGISFVISGVTLTFRRTYKWVRNSTLGHPKLLSWATYVTILYGLLSLVYTGIVTLIGVDVAGGPGNVVVSISFVLGLLGPGFLIGVLLAGSVPSSD